MVNIAHRGYSLHYPENTMLAFRKAVEAGCGGIELDVQMAKDGTPVIIHDETLERTTGGKGLVGDFTYRELLALEAGSGERIPSLEEYLEFAGDCGVLTNIELKNGVLPYPGMEEAVIALVRRFGLEEKVLLSSFHHPSLLRCKALAPEIPCAFLYDCRLIEGGGYAKRHGVECLNPKHYNVTAEAVAEARANDVGVIPWVVNRREDMVRLAELGVYGIITDDPALLAQVLAELA